MYNVFFNVQDTHTSGISGERIKSQLLDQRFQISHFISCFKLNCDGAFAAYGEHAACGGINCLGSRGKVRGRFLLRAWAVLHHHGSALGINNILIYIMGLHWQGRMNA